MVGQYSGADLTITEHTYITSRTCKNKHVLLVESPTLMSSQTFEAIVDGQNRSLQQLQSSMELML
jgi:hypothetical protein